jgi:predicted nucleotidyltransferase
MTENMQRKTVQTFLNLFQQWAYSQQSIKALALVGSYARGKETEESDIDMVVLCSYPEIYLTDTSWVNQFGEVIEIEFEDSGMVQEVRVRYEDGFEVEYGITFENWAGLPLDKGTKRVIDDGMIILFEREPLLSIHQSSSSKQGKSLKLNQ